mmetsp:Transcript_95220/g.188657  ORF Transcript_95220/g.188657 Transcript_95220/m.188657 type:complete len:248 (+) Transcript_95220:1189-1932(+)
MAQPQATMRCTRAFQGPSRRHGERGAALRQEVCRHHRCSRPCFSSGHRHHPCSRQTTHRVRSNSHGRSQHEHVLSRQDWCILSRRGQHLRQRLFVGVAVLPMRTQEGKPCRRLKHRSTQSRAPLLRAVCGATLLRAHRARRSLRKRDAWDQQFGFNRGQADRGGLNRLALRIAVLLQIRTTWRRCQPEKTAMAASQMQGRSTTPQHWRQLQLLQRLQWPLQHSLNRCSSSRSSNGGCSSSSTGSLPR